MPGHLTWQSRGSARRTRRRWPSHQGVEVSDASRTPQRLQHELKMLILLGLALTITVALGRRPWNRSTPSQELCQQVGGPQLFRCWGALAVVQSSRRVPDGRRTRPAAPLQLSSSRTTRSSWRLTMRCGPPCSISVSWPRPVHTWSRGWPSTTPNCTAHMAFCMVGTTP